MSHFPSTPRVISPSPTPSDFSGSGKDYFGPVTRSVARRSRVSTPAPVAEDSPTRRSRTRSRSPVLQAKMAPLTSGGSATAGKVKRRKSEVKQDGAVPQQTNGHLAPPSESKSSLRGLSRSPSPLGLIPVHLHFRSFIHRHEIPRKVLHVSIGFLTTYLYTKGYQPDQIHPTLLALLIPIATTDILRHRWKAMNDLFIRFNGPLMRESEVAGYNGVIWYLLGAWAVLRFLPKDIGAMSVILLSWCDTAASTAGRRWGRYTRQIRRGKSLAGSLAAMVVGVLAAAWFWGYVAPRNGGANGWDTGEWAFAFQGRLSLPTEVQKLLGLENATISGNIALAVISLWTGFIASASEAVDLFGWDDNFTIPILCGAGLLGFLRVFGSA